MIGSSAFPATCTSNRSRQSQGKYRIWIKGCRQRSGWIRLSREIRLGQFQRKHTLQESVENYQFYPEAVLADKIYRNRENL
jgi:hypothetical protein